MATAIDHISTDFRKFTCLLAKRILPGVGHDVPQEAPEAFAQAVQEVTS